MQPIIVYFADSSQWLSRAVPKSNHKDFVSKVQEMFDQLPGPVVLICGQNKAETGSKEKERFVSFKSLSSYMTHTHTYTLEAFDSLSIVFQSVDNIHSIFFSFVSFSFESRIQQTMVLPNLGHLAKLVRLAKLLKF
jgi:hypothetical protein